LPAGGIRRIRALARHSHPRLPRAHSEHPRARCGQHFDRNLLLARAELLEGIPDRFFYRSGRQFYRVVITHVAGAYR